MPYSCAQLRVGAKINLERFVESEKIEFGEKILCFALLEALLQQHLLQKRQRHFEGVEGRLQLKVFDFPHNLFDQRENYQIAETRRFLDKSEEEKHRESVKLLALQQRADCFEQLRQ